MRPIDEDTITQLVIARHAQAADPRLREVMTSLVQHLHAFAREQRLTAGEWQRGLSCLAAAGRDDAGHGPELAWLSDALGLSSLVAAMTQRQRPGCTEATLAAPLAPLPATEGEPCWLKGQVRSAQGRPLPGAQLWLGLPDAPLVAQADGRYQGRGLAWPARPLPGDGLTGQLLQALGRPAWRPAHLPVTVRAAGHRRLTTQLFRRDDPHLDTDAALAARPSLVTDWRPAAGVAAAGEACRYRLQFDFVLEPT